MKKILAWVGLVCALILSSAAAVYASGTDTLVDWDIRVTTPEDAVAVLEGNDYYIYTQTIGTIPYVLLHPYGYSSEEAFFEDFNSMMENAYGDLEIVSGPEEVTIGDKTGYAAEYSYTVSGYAVKDRRFALTRGDRTYMFASKEVPELGKTLGDTLERVVEEAVFLTEDAIPEPEPEPEYATLEDWGIEVAVPGDAAGFLEEDGFYLYPGQEGVVPFVMVCAFPDISEEEVIEILAEAAKESGRDFTVTFGPERVKIGSKIVYELDCTYTVSRYEVLERLMAVTEGDFTYLFASKEIGSLGRTVDGLLERTVEMARFTGGGEDRPEKEEKAPEYDTLPEWGIRVPVPAGTSSVLEGTEYYIYPQSEGYIPYVMVCADPGVPEEEYIEAFTEAMGDYYGDLEVISGPEQISIGDLEVWEVDYTYEVSGFAVLDRRIILTRGDRTYMFASKEVPELEMTVDGLLEQVVELVQFTEEAPKNKADDVVTVEEWDLEIAVPEGTEAVLEEEEFYLYPGEADSIPWVMIRPYGYASSEEFLKDFTDYMLRVYPDLSVTEDIHRRTIGGRAVYEIDYEYTISGFTAKDRRIALTRGDVTYMFASKEIPELDLMVGDLLDRAVESARFLSEEPGTEVGPEPADDEFALAYLYCNEKGMPKYWLDFTGTYEDGMILHAYYLSGDPTYYERIYLLEVEPLDEEGNTVEVTEVTDQYGNDVTEWFTSFVIGLQGRNLHMSIERDPGTLAGGAEDNILTGEYDLEPMGTHLDYAYTRETDGQLKYWLDNDGENYLLHALFRSGDPEYYERVFTLETESAEWVDDTLVFHTVYSQFGEDVSHWFKELSLTEEGSGIIMEVVRDESTYAGGADDNILTGTYELYPRLRVSPLQKGPYPFRDLGRWAQYDYFFENGFFPPCADVTPEEDGTCTIQLYEVVEQDGVSHTATSAWYSVDAYGVGENMITGEPVDLFR